MTVERRSELFSTLLRYNFFVRAESDISLLNLNCWNEAKALAKLAWWPVGWAKAEKNISQKKQNNTQQ